MQRFFLNKNTGAGKLSYCFQKDMSNINCVSLKRCLNHMAELDSRNLWVCQAVI